MLAEHVSFLLEDIVILHHNTVPHWWSHIHLYWQLDEILTVRRPNDIILKLKDDFAELFIYFNPISTTPNRYPFTFFITSLQSNTSFTSPCLLFHSNQICKWIFKTLRWSRRYFCINSIIIRMPILYLQPTGSVLAQDKSIIGLNTAGILHIIAFPKPHKVHRKFLGG